MMKTKWIFMLMIGMLAMACTDDDDFSMSPSHTLTFSTDEVHLGTVFSAVPTATQSFWVYNRSGYSLRCRNIQLQNGNQTGFRVNVDGSYLSPTSGFQVSDVEIRKGDSIRVFVELTSPLNHQTEPIPLTDNLLFNLESGVQQIMPLGADTWDAAQVTDWVVSENTFFESTQPTIIYGGITVAEGATLTIGAGTTLYFHPDAGINVHGRLVVQGTAEQPVVLRGDRIDNMFDYLPYDNVSGQWKGIHFYETSYDNSIDHADIHSTCDAVVCDASDVSKLKLRLYNTIVHNCQGYGLRSVHSVVDVQNSQITNTLADCVSILGGVAYFLHCTIAQFYPFDGDRGVALRFTNYEGDNKYPLYAMDCVNTIVTGYADDVIMGDADEEATYQFSFHHCLLRTPPIEDSDHVHDIIWEPTDDEDGYGWHMFKVFDTDNLVYDFHLAEGAAAIGKADPAESLPLDLSGTPRDAEPDLGCYEYVKTEE